MAQKTRAQKYAAFHGFDKPEPTLAEAIELGAIKAGTTEDEWQSLTPGMRREIVRQALRLKSRNS